jgi:Flp pilus assembly protein TadB
MPDHIYALGSIVAGASSAFAIFAIVHPVKGIDAATWLARRYAHQIVGVDAPVWSKALEVGGMRDRLTRWIARAGWTESPERITALAIAISGSITVLGVAVSSLMPAANGAILGASGFAVGIGCCALVLRSAIAGRRRRLAAELVPLLELFTLGLSGGGNAVSALGTVTSRVQGELAADLRRLLIAAQVAGSLPFEARLMQQAEQLEIPPFASLATILAASREYGTGVIHGVRALAMDLRHAQRRELIVQSRRALNHVLIPAAVGVLLPFLAIVMFPAVTALQRNLY